MSDTALALTQLRYDQKSFWRNPQYVFFTVVQPIIFLFIFVTVFGNKTTLVDGHLIERSTYYVPAILTLAIMSATIFNLFNALLREFDPATRGAGLALGDLAVIAVWGVAAILLSVWRFRWTPKTG
jgi:hypothetical protein